MKKRFIFTTALAISCGAVMTIQAAESADSAVNLPNVEVQAIGKSNVMLLPLDVRTITEETIEKSTEASLLPVLQAEVPGLFITERGFAGYGLSNGSAGTVNIRGVGQGNKVLFMIDGMPQWAGLFGHSLPDIYTANGVDKVEVVKGPSSLLYGSGAMAGSVNIITHRHQQDGWYGRARATFGSFNTQRFNLGTGVRYQKIEANVAGQLVRSNGNREGSAFWEANELMQFKYSPDSHWQIGAITQLTQAHADNPGTTYEPLKDMWTYMFRGTSAIFANDDYGITHGGVQAFINWGRHKVDDGYNAEAGETPRDYIFRSTDYNMGFNIFQTMHFWSGNDLSAGVDFQHWGGHSWNLMKTDGKQVDLYKECVNEVGVYLMMQQAFIHDMLDVNAGVRYQHGNTYGNEWIPQAGFIFRPFNGSSLKFSFGKGFRAPNLRELYMYAPANPDLRPESMLNYEVELRQNLFDNRLSLGLSLYFINAKNMIQTQMIEGRPRNVNTGKFINKGIEFDFNYIITNEWRLNGSYAYLHSSNNALTYAPKNKVGAKLEYNPGDLELSLEEQSIWGLKNGNPENKSVAYSLLNFRAAYTFHSKCDIQPFIKLDNLTNNRYEVIYGCPMPGLTILGGVELKF